ncbi:MAG: hypothetical protein B7Y01_03905 [Xanthobacter sp. 17-67-6]|nr:MAG: hypothetical protein B7Y01_03905 [Xanthobacter sp. 17-67-6]
MREGHGPHGALPELQRFPTMDTNYGWVCLSALVIVALLVVPGLWWNARAAAARFCASALIAFATVSPVRMSRAPISTLFTSHKFAQTCEFKPKRLVQTETACDRGRAITVSLSSAVRAA